MSQMPPKGYVEKNIKMLAPNMFLSKDNGTFIRQTFRIVSESILSFFSFGQKEPKIQNIGFLLSLEPF